MICSKVFCIRFDKNDGFIRVYDRTRYLVLFDPEKHKVFYNEIRYLISQRSAITSVSSYKYAKIKIDSLNSLHLQKKLTLYNVIIVIKPVFNKMFFDSITMLRCGKRKVPKEQISGEEKKS